MFSVPFSFREAQETRTETLQAYFGPDVQRNSPEGLLKSMEQAGATWQIPMLVLTCSLDPVDEIINPSRVFSELCEQLAPNNSSRPRFEARLIEGHNHISPVFSVGTGKGNEEAWAVGVNEWMRSLATKN